MADCPLRRCKLTPLNLAISVFVDVLRFSPGSNLSGFVGNCCFFFSIFFGFACFRFCAVYKSAHVMNGSVG